MIATIHLPIAYKNYLDSGQPADGFTNLELAGYFILWPLNEIEDLNREYEVNVHAPGFIAFGSNGGGEFLVFDLNGSIFAMPAIGMRTEVAIKIADSWLEFASHIEVD